MSDGSKSRKPLPKATPLTPGGQSAQVPLAKPVVPANATPLPIRDTSPAAKSGSYYPSRRSSSRQTVVLIVILLILLAGASGAGYVLLFTERLQPAIVVKAVPTQTVDELSPLTLRIAAETRDIQQPALRYRLVQGPNGAVLDEATGQLTWTPTEEQGPGAQQFVVEVRNADPPVSATSRFSVSVREVNQPPVVAAIADQAVRPGAEVALQVSAKDPDTPARSLRFSLEAGAAAGARIDPRTGEFRWTPPEGSKPAECQFTVKATEAVAGGLSATVDFKVRVMPADLGPVDRLLAELQKGGTAAEKSGQEPYAPFTGTCHLVRLHEQVVRIFEYANASAAAQDASQVSADAATLFGKPMTWDAVPHLFRKDALLALYTGTDQKVLAALKSQFGEPFAIGKMTEKPAIVESRPKIDPGSKELKQLAELYTTNKKIFVAKEYPTLRKIFADRFERQYQNEIRAGLGADYDAMMSWFQEHLAIKEELYLAIDPKHDKIPAVFALFRDLKKQFPKKFDQYANLAIATAIVWDNPGGLYDYEQHQRRTKSKLPDGMLGAAENFKYFADTENVMQGRARFLPWEFLVHMIDHKTPRTEREWALTNYLPKRAMFGRCYSDVPYDRLMLDTNDAECKLQGQLYTLPNLRSLGGVCAMQADFAGRVGKSLGVPAAYITGVSRYGELHAWVMWVELKDVAEDRIVFSLESHGRYRYDKYYVGDLVEPHTCQRTTDRALELRLHTVGISPHNKRQAELIMAAYPLLRDELKLDVEDQLVFLNKVISLSPGNEDAWRAVARMSRQGVITAKQQKHLKQAVDGLFRTFANFPDFTWTIFDDLVAYYEKPKEKNPLYETLIGLYVKAGRPDLACEARLKYTDYLVEQKKSKDAVEGLAATIKVFPDEGRYVPRLLDKLEATCKNIDGSGPLLVKFYQAFLPNIPPLRGDRPSPYCIEMYERGIKRFQEAGQTALAQAAEAQLEKVRAGKVKPGKK